MRTVNSILLLLLLGSSSLVSAQKPAGMVSMKFENQSTVSFLIEIHYKNYADFDDSLTCWGLNPNTLRISYFEKNILPDSICVLKYKFQDIFSTDGMFTDMFSFGYNHQQDSLIMLTSTRRNSALNPGNYETPQFLSPIVYRHPQQNLTFNLFKIQPVFQQYDTTTYEYLIDQDYSSRLNPKTGIISLEAGDMDFPDHFSLDVSANKQSIRRSRQPLEITLITDSTLPGHFAFDPIMEDPNGFLWYAPNTQTTQSFSFLYIDPTADSIGVNTYSPLFNLGSTIQTTTLQHGDTFDIQVTFPITETTKRYLPTPINFEILPYSQSVLKPRLVSVAIGEKTTVGLSEAKASSPISIYPNPSSGEFLILSSSKIKSLQVLNTTGITCYQSNSSADSVNLSSLPNGLYYITLETTEGLSHHTILLQHKN